MNCIPNEENNNGNLIAFSFSVAWGPYYFGFDTGSGSIRFGLLICI